MHLSAEEQLSIRIMVGIMLWSPAKCLISARCPQYPVYSAVSASDCPRDLPTFNSSSLCAARPPFCQQSKNRP